MLLLMKTKNFCLYYITEIIATPEAVMPFPWPTIYSTIKDLSVGEAMLTEETGRFPDSSVKIKNALAWFKKNRGIKCEKLGGFIAEYNF